MRAGDDESDEDDDEVEDEEEEAECVRWNAGGPFWSIASGEAWRHDVEGQYVHNSHLSSVEYINPTDVDAS